MKRKVTYTIGLIKLDGSDTGPMHFVNETDVETLKARPRVEAVFAKERVHHRHRAFRDHRLAIEGRFRETFMRRESDRRYYGEAESEIYGTGRDCLCYDQ
jgi:hypothetical protein